MDAVSSSQKPIVPAELYRAVRDSHLIGMSGYSKEVPFFFSFLSKSILILQSYESMWYVDIMELIMIGTVYLLKYSDNAVIFSRGCQSLLLVQGLVHLTKHL